jgi:hypothetical protein
MKLGALDAATPTSDLGPAVVDFHQLGEAGGIIRVFGLKLFEGVFGHDYRFRF